MLNVLAQLSWFFKEERSRYVLAVFALVIVSIVDLMPAWLIGQAVDQFQLGRLHGQTVWTLVGWFILIILLSYAMNYVYMYLILGGSFVVGRKLRSRYMRHLLRMDVPFYEKRRSGNLLARGTNDIEAISAAAGYGIMSLMDVVLYMVIVLGAMAMFVDWKLTIAAVLPLPLIAVTLSLLGKKIHNRFAEAQAAFGDLNDRILESVAGMRVIRAFRRERHNEEKFRNMSESVYERNVKVARIESLIEPIVGFVVALSFVIGLGYGAYLVFGQQLSLGQLVTFSMYLVYMIYPMYSIGMLVNIMQRGRASLDRVNEILAVDEAVPDPEVPANAASSSWIQFQDVSFSYPGTDDKQLADLSLTIQAGETVGIVGKTGSGKSTFVKQLLKFYPDGSGTISIGGIPLSQQEKAHVRQWIGYVPQDHVLFSQSVRENILTGKPDASEEELQDAIRASAFDQDLVFLPKGLDTLVGENGISLSGGQKQRIAIARALLADPDILILDDSLSAVDAKTEAKIMANIRQQRAGKTTLITTHRMSVVEHADQILVFENGRLAERGTHQQLMRAAGWYAGQVESQNGSEEVFE